MKQKFITIISNLFFVAISLTLLCLGACTSVSTNLPTTRFESPEVPGHLYTRLAIGGGTTQSVTYTTDASERKNANLRIDLGAPTSRLLMRLCASTRCPLSVKLGISNLVSTLLKTLICEQVQVVQGYRSA